MDQPFGWPTYEGVAQEMKNDTPDLLSYELLNQLLVEWHRWANGFAPVAAFGKCPMWQGNLSSRQWDSENEAVDGALHNSQMKTFDFEVDQLALVFRTALQIQARNLHCGSSVWNSARLPVDEMDRRRLLVEAREALLSRLALAGLM